MKRILWLVLALGLIAGQAFAGATLAPYTPRPGVQVVCTRAGSPMNGPSTASLQRYNQALLVQCPYGAKSLQLLLPGWWQGGGNQGSYRGELPLNDSIFYLKGIKSITSGGTGYVAGSYLPMPTWNNGYEEAVVKIDTVSGGVITSAHVVRGGVYLTALADNTAPLAVWEAGKGFGGHFESNGFVGSNITGYNFPANTGGMNYVAPTIAVAPGPGGSGGTISVTVDTLTGAVNGTPPAGTWTFTTTTAMPAQFAVSECASTCGSGAQFVMDWDGAAYMARISVDPVASASEACANTTNGACPHRVVTASTGHPANTGVDALGTQTDIYVTSGTNLMTDPVPVNIPVGGTARIREFCFGACPRGRYTQMPGDVSTTAFADPDKTMAGTFGAAYPTPTLALQPEAIMGIPVKAGPALMIIGDSREAGTSGLADATTMDTFDTVNGLVGFLERATGGQIPFVNMSRSGDAIYTWGRNRAQRYDAFRKIQLAGKFPELCYYGLDVNDFHTGVTFATAQQQEIQTVNDMRGFGCRFVFTDTTDPWVAGSGTTVGMAWAEITTPGTGYGANTTFTATIAGGTCTTQPTASVTTDAGGVPRQVNSTTPGSCTANPASPNTVTGGAGSGLTLTPFLSNVGPGTQTPNSATNTQLQLRNAQLRTAGFGSYAGVYDGVIDNAGITETVAGSGVWMAYCSNDGVHAGPNCSINKAANDNAPIARWAAQAFGMP